MDTLTVREKKMVNSNFRLLSRELERLSIDVNFEANIARFSSSALRQTKSLIIIHWKSLRNKGVRIALDLYKTLLKQYLLYRSQELQRARRIEAVQGVRAG